MMGTAPQASLAKTMPRWLHPKPALRQDLDMSVTLFLVLVQCKAVRASLGRSTQKGITGFAQSRLFLFHSYFAGSGY